MHDPDSLDTPREDALPDTDVSDDPPIPIYPADESDEG
jgi:hypothetical protein